MSAMIHCVYFWLNEDLSDEQRKAFAEEGLKPLTTIDVVDSGDYGPPAPTPGRPVTDHSFDFALQLRFRSVEDHNTYQEHPDHHVFVKRFRPWFKEVKVFDSVLS